MLFGVKEFPKNPGQFKWFNRETICPVSIGEFLKWNLMRHVVEMFQRLNLFQWGTLIFSKLAGDKVSVRLLKKTFSCIGKGDLIWDQRGTFSKIINWESYWDLYHRGIWTECI